MEKSSCNDLCHSYRDRDLRGTYIHAACKKKITFIYFTAFFISQTSLRDGKLTTEKDKIESVIVKENEKRKLTSYQTEKFN